MYVGILLTALIRFPFDGGIARPIALDSLETCCRSPEMVAYGLRELQPPFVRHVRKVLPAQMLRRSITKDLLYGATILARLRNARHSTRLELDRLQSSVVR